MFDFFFPIMLFSHPIRFFSLTKSHITNDYYAIISRKFSQRKIISLLKLAIIFEASELAFHYVSISQQDRVKVLICSKECNNLKLLAQMFLTRFQCF